MELGDALRLTQDAQETLHFRAVKAVVKETYAKDEASNGIIC